MAVIVESRDGLSQSITAGAHRLIADEPVGAGGRDDGPTPYDLLLAALGACTAMTISLYASRKGWPVGGIRVELDHSRVHAHDCENCEQESAKIDYIRKRVTISGALSEEQRARLAEISERCPVQRTLLGTIRIDGDVRLDGGAP